MVLDLANFQSSVDAAMMWDGDASGVIGTVIALLSDLVSKNGHGDEEIMTKGSGSSALPGFYEQTTEWDFMPTLSLAQPPNGSTKWSEQPNAIQTLQKHMKLNAKAKGGSRIEEKISDLSENFQSPVSDLEEAPVGHLRRRPPIPPSGESRRPAAGTSRDKLAIIEIDLYRAIEKKSEFSCPNFPPLHACLPLITPLAQDLFAQAHELPAASPQARKIFGCFQVTPRKNAVRS